MLGFEATCRWLAARMNQFGMAGIVSVMLLVCADIFWRIVYVPIMGVYDLVELITGFAIAFTVPYTIFTKGNVVVSLIVNRFPEKHQSVVEIGTLCLSMVLLGVITAETAMGCSRTYRGGHVTPTLYIPLYYLYAAFAFAFAMGCLMLLIEFINTIRRMMVQ